MTDKTYADLTVVTSLNASDLIAVYPSGGPLKVITRTNFALALFSATPLSIALGGTGATTATGVRSNLGLGTMALQASNNVSITGGGIDGTTIGGATQGDGFFNFVQTLDIIVGAQFEITSNTITFGGGGTITCPPAVGGLAINTGVGGSGSVTTADLTVSNSSTFPSGTWTPVVTFATPGDLSVIYTVQTGDWEQIGNRIHLTFSLSFTPTFTTASGAFRIDGIPANAVAASVGGGVFLSLNAAFVWTGFTSLNLFLGATNLLTVLKTGPSLTSAATTTSLPTGVAQVLTGSIWYRV